jgi:hypothetical protein
LVIAMEVCRNPSTNMPLGRLSMMRHSPLAGSARKCSQEVSPLRTTSRAGRAVDAGLDIGGVSLLKIWVAGAAPGYDLNWCSA